MDPPIISANKSTTASYDAIHRFINQKRNAKSLWQQYRISHIWSNGRAYALAFVASINWQRILPARVRV
jgi:hypothetical protein